MIDHDARARIEQLVVSQCAALGHPEAAVHVEKPRDGGLVPVTVLVRRPGRSDLAVFAVPLGEPAGYEEVVERQMRGWLEGD